MANAHQAVELTIYHSGDTETVSHPRLWRQWPTLTTQFCDVNARPGIWLTPLACNLSAIIVQTVMIAKIIRFSRGMSMSHTKTFSALTTIMSCLLCMGILCNLIFGLGYPILLEVSRLA